MSKLPVLDVVPQIKKTLDEIGAAVLIAPPGAGKTTAVPLALLNEPWLTNRKIIMLEPRRLAARTAANRMANTLGEPVGQTVGYRMRLDTKVSSNTRIEIVTDGVFQQMILDDPELHGVGLIIFDEFHERSLNADFGLALTLDVRGALRDDLRVLVMSATLDGDRVSKLMDNAPLIQSEGRMFPVEFAYQPRRADERIEDAIAMAVRQALIDHTGSLLCFLPGQAEIRRTSEKLDGKLPANTFLAPLFGAMDIRDQAIAVQQTAEGQRKIVLATSLAETSITIDGVRIVIDSGLARQPRYEAAMGISRLETVRASKASIDQRAGRAGRTAPGIAIRLWAQAQTSSLADFEDPEIMQADLAGFLLSCLKWGVRDPAELKLLDQPPKPHLLEAEKTLLDLGAIDDKGNITAKGRAIAELSLEPRLAAMVLAGHGLEDRKKRAFLAMLINERGLGGNGSDLENRFERAWRENSQRAKQLRHSAERLAKSIGVGGNNGSSSVAEMLCDAFPDRIAKRRDQSVGHYIMANGRGVMIDETDSLAKEKYLIVADLAGNAKSARILSAAPMIEDLMLEKFSAQIVNVDEFIFDKSSGKLGRKTAQKLGAISLSTAKAPLGANEKTTLALIEALRQHGLTLINWTKETASLRTRINWLFKTLGTPWPDMSDAALIESTEDWLGPFLDGKTGFAQLTTIDLKNALMSRVPYELQQELKHLAPTHFEVPTGSNIALDYDTEGQSPILAVRVQELFGLNVHPSIAGGKILLMLELLSPAHRPIQVTRDLPAFWQGSWRDVRADMRGRYPRHEWPENPAEAAPTSRAKPRN